MLSVQEGAKHFYLEKGLISYCKDPICMTTIGNKRCTACDEDNNEDNFESSMTTMQWNNKVITDKINDRY